MSGLRRSVGPHRVPGICISLLGFLLLFAGIMMVAMGETIRSHNSNDIKIGGAVTLVLGIGSITAGFIYQYIVHRDWKKKRLAKQMRRKANREITGRARDYIEDGPCTSGSMVDLGITEEIDDYTYGLSNPYADEDIETAQEGYEDEGFQAKFDIFTVTPSPDIIIHSESEDALRSSSASPHVICNEVIDDLSDSDDDVTLRSENISQVSQLNVNRLVDRAYSPRLSRQNLNALASELEDEVEIEPLPRKHRNRSQRTLPAKRHDEDIDSSQSTLQEENKSSDFVESNDLPVIKRKFRKRFESKGDKKITKNGTQDSVSSSVDEGRDSPLEPEQISTKGKATAGSAVKSSKLKSVSCTNNSVIDQQRCDSVESFQSPTLSDADIQTGNGVVDRISDDNWDSDSDIVDEVNSGHRKSENEPADWDKRISGHQVEAKGIDVGKLNNLISGHTQLSLLTGIPAQVSPQHAAAFMYESKNSNDWDSDISDDLVPAVPDPLPGEETCDSRCS